MRRLLFTMFMCVLVNPVWSVANEIGLSWVQGNESKPLPPIAAWPRENTVERTCEQRMEAAMRAMEPFMLRFSHGKFEGEPRMRNFWFDPAVSPNDDEEIFQRWKPAWDLWNAAKKDCWVTR